MQRDFLNAPVATRDGLIGDYLILAWKALGNFMQPVQQVHFHLAPVMTKEGEC